MFVCVIVGMKTRTCPNTSHQSVFESPGWIFVFCSLTLHHTTAQRQQSERVERVAPAYLSKFEALLEQSHLRKDLLSTQQKRTETRADKS